MPPCCPPPAERPQASRGAVRTRATGCRPGSPDAIHPPAATDAEGPLPACRQTRSNSTPGYHPRQPEQRGRPPLPGRTRPPLPSGRPTTSWSCCRKQAEGWKGSDGSAQFAPPSSPVTGSPRHFQHCSREPLSAFLPQPQQGVPRPAQRIHRLGSPPMGMVLWLPLTAVSNLWGLLTIVPNSQASNTKKCLRIPKLLDKLLHFVYIYLVNSIFKPCHQARHNAKASPSWSY